MYLLWWPWWHPKPSPGVVDSALTAGENALKAAYLSGFKDGFLLAVAVFSILFLLFKRD